MEYYSDSDLQARYRFGRETTARIVGFVENKIVLITLRFLAAGIFLKFIGDIVAAILGIAIVGLFAEAIRVMKLATHQHVIQHFKNLKNPNKLSNF